MKQTTHSEYLKLGSVFLKDVRSAFISQDILQQQYQDLNYLSVPHFENALNEYQSFAKILKVNGAEVQYFETNSEVTIDSIYCRDASIATDFGMIICRMGKGARSGEPSSQMQTFSNLNIPVLGIIESPGTLEGGDVAWLDKNTLAVGHTYRTNVSGISQLKSMLEPRGVTVIVADLPHYKGKNDVFHLMSILSPIDKDLAVVFSPLMPIRFRNALLSKGFELIEVPDTEFESMGCNVLAIAPRTCVMVDGNPKTQKLLEKAGCKVYTYRGAEISVKGGGGPTCLTRPMLRYL